MRDLLVLLLVCASIPLIIMRPWIGVIVWSWLGYMNPHRLAWGFAYDYPFAQVVAAVTLASLLAAMFMGKEKLRAEGSVTLCLWLALVLWMNLTTLPSARNFSLPMNIAASSDASVTAATTCAKG